MTSQSNQQGGFFSNLLFNIIIPTLVLTKLNTDDYLGPTYSIIVALAFPIGYGLWEMKQTGKINAFSVLGVISVLLTGGMSLLQIDPKYIAIKEAAIPGLIGCAVIVSHYMGYSLVKTLILNGNLLNMELIEEKLNERRQHPAFEKAIFIVTQIVAGSFFFSSVLNYILARIILQSPPNTPEYAAELGKMTAMGYVVIALPSMAVLMSGIFYLLYSLKKLTGLDMESMMRQ